MRLAAALMICTFALPVWAQDNGGAYVPGSPVEVPTMEQFKGLEAKVDANTAKIAEHEARLRALEEGGGGPVDPPIDPPVEPPEPPDPENPDLPDPPTENEVTVYLGNSTTGETFGTDKDAPRRAQDWLNKQKQAGRINVPAGNYEDVGSVTVDTVFNCARGAEFNRPGQLRDQKGMWTVKNANFTLVRCSCTNAHSSSNNGSCLRNESGKRVEIHGVYFAGGENGILGNSSPRRLDAVLYIADSVIECNGKWTSGRTHNVYTGAIGLLEIHNSRIRGIRGDGHDIKTLANRTVVKGGELGGNKDTHPDVACDSTGASQNVDIASSAVDQIVEVEGVLLTKVEDSGDNEHMQAHQDKGALAVQITVEDTQFVTHYESTNAIRVRNSDSSVTLTNVTFTEKGGGDYSSYCIEEQWCTIN